MSSKTTSSPRGRTPHPRCIRRQESSKGRLGEAETRRVLYERGGRAVARLRQPCTVCLRGQAHQPGNYSTSTIVSSNCRCSLSCVTVFVTSPIFLGNGIFHPACTVARSFFVVKVGFWGGEYSYSGSPGRSARSFNLGAPVPYRASVTISNDTCNDRGGLPLFSRSRLGHTRTWLRTSLIINLVKHFVGVYSIIS